MSDFTLTIKKNDIYEEVAKTTAYIGKKTTVEDGKSAFDQIFVTEADLAMIERFFNESLDALRNVLKRFISGGSGVDGTINWELEMTSRFDENLLSSINSSANSFLVNSIIGKWCEIAANEKAKEYADNAVALLLDIKDKAFYKKNRHEQKYHSMARKSLTITLYMSELIYDFQNKAFLTGRSRRAASMDAEAASNIQASDDDEDKNQALRSIQNAYSQLLVELSESVQTDTGTTASNELISGDTNITINLSLPSNYPLALKDALTSSIHDYIINKALMDWFIITNPNESKTYSELSIAAIKNLHETFNRRERPSRTAPNE